METPLKSRVKLSPDEVVCIAAKTAPSLPLPGYRVTPRRNHSTLSFDQALSRPLKRVPLTFRITETAYERLRRLSFETRVSQQAIVHRALEKFFAERAD